MFSSLRFVTLCLIVSAACASSKRIPTLKKIPARTVKLAHDTDNNIFVAYDRNDEIIGHIAANDHSPSLDKRILGTCSRLSADDIQKLPGWEKLRQYAIDNWGDGWDAIVSNPEGFPDRPATVCVGAEVTEVTLETPTCSELSQDTFSGSTQGTNVTVELTAEQGTVSTHIITVVEQSKIGVDMSVGASISIPEVVDISAKATFGVSFTNTLNKADTITEESLQGQIITMYAEPNTRCTLTVDKRRCDVNGEGSQRLVARGFAWVNYGSPRKDHFKWAMNMEEILNEDERSTFIRFRTASSTELKAEYKATCENPLAEMPAEVATQFQRL